MSIVPPAEAGWGSQAQPTQHSAQKQGSVLGYHVAVPQSGTGFLRC